MATTGKKTEEKKSPSWLGLIVILVSVLLMLITGVTFFLNTAAFVGAL